MKGANGTLKEGFSVVTDGLPTHETVNTMALMDFDGLVTETIELKHATKQINGIEIDARICALIEFLWSKQIETLRSCEDMKGYVYIAFRTVCDAVKVGLLISNGFILGITPNSVDGGYAAPSIFIPHENVSFPGLGHEDKTGGEPCMFAQKVFRPFLKELTCTNIVKRAYSGSDTSDVLYARALMQVLLVGSPCIVAGFTGDQFTFNVVNNDRPPYSKKELVKLEKEISKLDTTLEND